MKKSELIRWLLDVLALNVKVSIAGVVGSVVLLGVAIMCRLEKLPRGVLIEVGLITAIILFVIFCIASGFAYDYLNKIVLVIERKEEKNARKRKNKTDKE